MNKKLLFAGAALGLAGVAIYKVISADRDRRALQEIWTTADMPDLTGKVIIVTGANSGIGYEAAKEFARKGARTILACRSMEKAEAAFALLKDEVPDAPIAIMQLDLASLASVNKFAEAFKAKYDEETQKKYGDADE